jgi:starch synthase (maltosyl-transferring)
VTESRAADPAVGPTLHPAAPPPRVVIENVSPSVDGGRFSAKRTLGERVDVEADCFAEGHDALRCVLEVRRCALLPPRPGQHAPSAFVAPETTGGERTAAPGGPDRDEEWREIEMEPLGNDRFRASFGADQIGEYRYRVAAWVDPFTTWRRGLSRKHEAGQDISLDLAAGVVLLEQAAERARAAIEREAVEEARVPVLADGDPRAAASAIAPIVSRAGEHAALDRGAGARRGAGSPSSTHADRGLEWLRAEQRALQAWSRRLEAAQSRARRAQAALDPELASLMARWGERPQLLRSHPDLRVVVERARARYSTWYEMFPRSASPDPDRPGTLRDVEARLGYVGGMGFDVLYLPPIHPIGRSHRKGRNGALIAAPGDPGSPWAIGSEAGGHMAIDPELGTLEDFDRLVASARDHGIEIALDLAFQCSPDHPWVSEHPEWFRHRPDGSIQHAENPPKKYEDIVPFDFDGEAWPALWQALCTVVDFWIGHGVGVFRVDNPHTKPFAFWEWLIAQTRSRSPDVVFLAEAFTRPKVMYRLGKLGFTQSYTYFAWRNEPAELRRYFEELVAPPVADFFRPNVWPNTPDILTEYLQHGGRPAAAIRLVLAATLAASYGIYGPPFELLVSAARHPGSEEYLDSEKYQRRVWDVDRADSLRPLITRLNRIRHDNPALQQDRTLRFHDVDDEALVAYSKVEGDRLDTSRDEGPNTILCVVNTDAYAVRSGTVHLDLEALGIGDQPYQLHDLLSGARYFRRGADLPVVLDPGVTPAHVLRVRRQVRTERSFEYYL